MAVHPRRRSWRVLIAAGVLWGPAALGCSAQAPTPEKVTPQAEPDAEAAEPDAEAAEPDAKTADSGPKKAPPLTEEELALIAADPKDLTPEMRRDRAYARRKQIMQNPDSPTARALNDLAEAHRAGDINVDRREGVWFSLPGSKPTSGRPPAGWRPEDGKSTATKTPGPADAEAPSSAPPEGQAETKPQAPAPAPTSP